MKKALLIAVVCIFLTLVHVMPATAQVCGTYLYPYTAQYCQSQLVSPLTHELCCSPVDTIVGGSCSLSGGACTGPLPLIHRNCTDSCDVPDGVSHCMTIDENSTITCATTSCPSGTFYCPGCSSCMPNTKSCADWVTDSCGSGGPPPPPTWGACGTSCSNCPPGPPSQCVLAPNGSCLWDPGTCGGGGAACTVQWQPTSTTGTGPITMPLGQTVEVQAYANGAINWWDGTFTWNGANLGVVNPSSIGTGPTFVSNLTSNTAGSSILKIRVHEDGNYSDLKCEGSRQVTVLNCTANCSGGACGQWDGCTGTCPTTDDGGPVAVTNLRANGALPSGTVFTVTPTTDQVAFTWTAPPTLADAYEIRITPQGQVECTGGNTLCQAVSGTSYTWSGIPAGITIWEVRVRPINTTCAAYGGADNGTWTATHVVSLIGDVSGNFYYDPSNTCNPATASLVTPGTGSMISIAGLGGYSSTTGPSLSASSYTFPNTPYWSTNPNNVITFTPGLSGTGIPYRCNCGTDVGGNCVLSGISSPSSGNNFFFADVLNTAWWQVQGGNVYAAASSSLGIGSNVPPSAVCSAPGCSPFLLATNTAGDTDSAGIAVTNGSSLDTTQESDGYNTSRLTDRGSSVFNTATRILGTASGRQDFAFFKARFGLGNAPASDGFDPLNAQKPIIAPTNGGEAYYYQGDLIIKNAWQVASGESLTIFVDGNLTITDETPATPQLITVANGGYLAFIVKGNITIDPSVGNPVSTDATPNLEGIYVADGTISTGTIGGSADQRFVGAGSFVGWTGVSLQRVLPDPDNNTIPADLFIFRPDLVNTLPEPMTRPSYTWQETN